MNIERLDRELRRRSGGDPWLLDRNEILSSLAYLGFRSDRIRLLPGRPVELHAAPGDWISGDPLSPIFAADDDAVLRLPEAREGFHSFFRSGVQDERLDSWVTQGGWLSRSWPTGIGESGRW